jgi:DNA-binding Xre family transcriptional regulator
MQLQERCGDIVQLNEAVSMRLKELLVERDMTQYQLYMKSGVPKSSIGNIVNCAYDSVKLRLIHEICQGLNISISDFFNSPFFDETNLEP